MPADTHAFIAEGDPADILNWRRFDERLTTSGQPSEQQLESLRTLGVTHVINLGLPSHEKALKDEGASLATLGLAYTHIPVDFAAPDEDDFARFSALLADTSHERTHVHCIYNARVSAFLYRHQTGQAQVERALALLDSIWRPGGVWARFIGRQADAILPDRYAGRDY